MDTFNQAAKQITDEIANLVIGKQKDYGTGNILRSPVGAELGILVRLSDKLNRIANLQGKDPTNESLEDSWKDVAGYALVALMVRRKKFELPLE
jgi:uncharacterized membrane protein